MPISAATLAEMYAQSTEEQPVTLLTIHDPDNVDADPFPFLLCDRSEDFVSGGLTYQASIFQLIYPDQEKGKIGHIRLGIMGPPDSILGPLRLIDGPPPLDVQLVVPSDPNNAIRTWPGMFLRKLTAERFSISFELRYEDLGEKIFPPDRYSFPLYPALW